MPSVKKLMQRVASGNGLLGSNNGLMTMQKSIASKQEDGGATSTSTSKPKTKTTARRAPRQIRRTRSIQVKMQRFIQAESSLELTLPPPSSSGVKKAWDALGGDSEKTLPLEQEEDCPQAEPEPVVVEAQDQELDLVEVTASRGVKWHGSVDDQLEARRIRLMTTPSKIPKRKLTRQQLVLVFPLQDIRERVRQSLLDQEQDENKPPVRRSSYGPVDLDDSFLIQDDDDASVSSTSSSSSSSEDEEDSDASCGHLDDDDDMSLSDDEEGAAYPSFDL